MFKGGVSLRDCVIRLGLVGGALVPAVGGPGVVDEVPDGDDGVGQGDERLDHSGAHLGTDLEPTWTAGCFSDSACFLASGCLR